MVNRNVWTRLPAGNRFWTGVSGLAIATHRAGFVLLSALLIVAPPPDPAGAHGSTQSPASRVYTCRFENPDNTMCSTAWSANPQALYDWMEVNIGDAAGRHRELIPDGQLCSAGRAKYSAFDQPGEWPVTELRGDAAGLVDLVYTNTAPHSTEYYRVYITNEGFDARADSLSWNDLGLVFDSGRLDRSAQQTLRAPLPDRATPAILYIVWQRSDSPEAFYACSDVTISSGATIPAPPTTTAPTTTQPNEPSSTTAPSATTPSTLTTVPSTTVPLTTVSSTTAISTTAAPQTTASPTTAPPTTGSSITGSATPSSNSASSAPTTRLATTSPTAAMLTTTAVETTTDTPEITIDLTTTAATAPPSTASSTPSSASEPAAESTVVTTLAETEAAPSTAENDDEPAAAGVASEPSDPTNDVVALQPLAPDSGPSRRGSLLLMAVVCCVSVVLAAVGVGLRRSSRLRAPIEIDFTGYGQRAFDRLRRAS